jgi:hypothetical protein
VTENKTKPTDDSVTQYLNQVENDRKRDDSFRILKMMGEVTGEEPVMWGSSIVGFGSYHYKYESGREGDMPLTGFAPRKQSLTLYIMDGFEEYDELLTKLGKHKTGKACLYITKLEDVDQEVLRELLEKSVDHMKNTNP